MSVNKHHVITWDGIIPHHSSSWGLMGIVCSSAEKDQRVNLASYPRVSSMPGSNEEKPLNFKMTLNAYQRKLLKHQFSD